MTPWLERFKDAPFPYQVWCPFPDEAIVEIANARDERVIGPANRFWWGYELELGGIGECVITRVRRLDTPKAGA